MANHACDDRLMTFFTKLSNELLTKHGSHTHFATERLQGRMRKRAQFNRPELEEQTVNKFVELNDSIPSRRVALDPFVRNNAQLFIAKALERFTSHLDPDYIQGTLHIQYLFDNWRFGPGASFEVKGTHTAQKIESDMTCTVSAEPFVRYIRRNHPSLSFNDAAHNGGTRIVEGSKLTTVPKNEDTMRTIAVEPSGNMCLQLSAGMYLENALRCVGLDIRTQQPKNKAAARLGSITNSLATIDLKSASDLIQPELVRQLFPREWFELLMRLRSPVTNLHDGRVIKLNMISTMGNGYTFPLMTLILTALIYGYRCLYNKQRKPFFIDWHTTCVFGDDIIIPSDEFSMCVTTLESAGFIVNHDKSYCDGPFRESCGGDYYNGIDVTPFYVKTLATPSSIYVAINQVLSWCGRHELCLPHSIKYLISLLPSRPFLVPEWYGSDSGIRCIQAPRKHKYLKPQQYCVRLINETHLYSLAAGGYVSSRGAHVFFTPRVNNPRYKVCVGRIPKGYDHGWDPLTRSHREADWIRLLVDLI